MKNINRPLLVILIIFAVRAIQIYDIPETTKNYFSSSPEGVKTEEKELNMIELPAIPVNIGTKSYSKDLINNENKHSYVEPEEEQATESENNNYSFDSETNNNEDKEKMLDETKNIKSGIDDMDYEIRRLKRNMDNYDSYEYTRKLRNLEWRANDLSSQANDIGADDTASNLDDFSYQTRKMRREVENEPSYYYKEKNDEINQGLKRRSGNLEDSSSSLDDYSTNYSY
ncbi:MAG: hypothetical protein NTU76_01065 [Candidatus Taylorbacteria bacterium]|nr:hypothetical protein [Candidatus Taylorbacteria bacterium]